jgi:hypothetical protein
MTFLEAQQALARKLNIDFTNIGTNDLYELADLKEWIQFGLFEVWDMHPWPFTEVTYTQPTSALGASDGYYDHPQELMLGSIRRLAIGGKEFTGPLRFEDYLKFLDTNPEATDRIWAFHQEFLFVNPRAYTVGDDMDVLGKDLAPKLTNDDDLLPFSAITDDKEDLGNHAIVELAYAHALASEKLKRATEAELVRKAAKSTLETLWKPFSEFKSLEQSKDRPMFDVPDMFAGSGSGKGQIGNFNL